MGSSSPSLRRGVHDTGLLIKYIFSEQRGVREGGSDQSDQQAPPLWLSSLLTAMTLICTIPAAKLFGTKCGNKYTRTVGTVLPHP